MMDDYLLGKARRPDAALSDAEMVRNVTDEAGNIVATLARYSDKWGRFYVWGPGDAVPSSGASEPHNSWVGAFAVVCRWSGARQL